MLAEAGAEVVKIERPGGEELRRHPPYIDGESAVYALLNRGKKSIVLDLKAADAGARLAPLLAGCDVVVEQFRPGVMARLGLGYEAVKAMNPRVVYCAITGYGRDGPRRHEAGTISTISLPPGSSRFLPALRIVRPYRPRSSAISAAARCRR
jgi:crotonobetainyl-CoA:carnitine CoA-transferase CaiB-like acyl-CoA transferase